MYTCRTCNRAFSTELALELHLDQCETDQLFCKKCGNRFGERGATRDGWHYHCTDEECDGEGIGEDLVRVEDIRIRQG